MYRRLPGRGTSLAHYVRLFQGPDHLLQVSSTGFSELYKRFYFRDIQAITIRKTDWANLWTLVFGIFTLGFFLLGFDATGGGRIALWSFAGFFLLWLAIHLFLGPACICHVRTAVQVERLPTLRRIKAARKTINRLRPFIVQTQGQLSADDLAQRMQAARAGGLPSTAPDAARFEAPPIISDRESPPGPQTG